MTASCRDRERRPAAAARHPANRSATSASPQQRASPQRRLSPPQRTQRQERRLGAVGFHATHAAASPGRVDDRAAGSPGSCVPARAEPTSARVSTVMCGEHERVRLEALRVHLVVSAAFGADGLTERRCHEMFPQPRQQRRKPRVCRAFVDAPKRTRTSTRLSRTRPSTWQPGCHMRPLGVRPSESSRGGRYGRFGRSGCCHGCCRAGNAYQSDRGGSGA